jgi:protein-tyrosine phosphatase
MYKKILFICTGNYYRSRFAEMLFNTLASGMDLEWKAESRGFEPSIDNAGPVYPLVLNRLQSLGIIVKPKIRAPIRLEKTDLAQAGRIIALDETEHKPLMTQRFGQWADQTMYWDVPDLNIMKAEDAFSRMEQKITALVQQLQQHTVP